MDIAATLLDDRYKLLRRLGAGGMAEVWLALDLRLDRPVALKILRPEYAADLTLAQRLEQEARAVAQLDSPAIVQVFDVIHAGPGGVAIVMEYLPSGDLKSLLMAEAPLPFKQALTLAHEIAQGVAAAHAVGLIHRDLKPSNVLLTRHGRVKVADFGLARAVTTQGQLTQPGTVWGTTHYIAPEQAQGRLLTPAADVYAIGVILFEMLAGQLPFPGDDPLAVALAHVQQPPPDLRELLPAIPPSVARLVARLLAKEPEDRPANAEQLLRLLDRYLFAAGEQTANRPITPPRPRAALPPSAPPAASTPPPRATVIYSILVAGLLLCLVAGLGVVFSERMRLQAMSQAATLPAPEVVTTTPTPLPASPTATNTAPAAIPTPTATGAPPTALAGTAPLTATAGVRARQREGNGPLFQAIHTRPDRIVIDGSLAEWGGPSLPLTTVTFGVERWESPRDLSGEAWAAWDDRFLYIALRVQDDIHVQTQRGWEFYRGDATLLWLDTDLEGDFDVAGGNADDWYLGFSPGDFEQLRAEGVIALPVRDAALNATVRVRAQPRPEGYTIEASIPWATLGMTPAPGLLLGYAVEVIDNDLPGIAEEQSRVGAIAGLRWNRPTTFATLVLLP